MSYPTAFVLGAPLADPVDDEYRPMPPCCICPFCNSKQVAYGTCWVRCMECRAYGPVKATLLEAVAAWNATGAARYAFAAGICTRMAEELRTAGMTTAAKKLQKQADDLTAAAANVLGTGMPPGQG